MTTRFPKGISEGPSNTALVTVIPTTHEAAVKNSTPTQNRVIVNGRIPLQSDREALCRWALTLRAELIGSKHATVRWGRGGGVRIIRRPFHDRHCKDAGVRLEQGNVLVLETYRSQELRRVPLAEVVLDVVKAMHPPEVEKWSLEDGIGLLVYCEYLEENEHPKIARTVRRWAAEITNPAQTDTTARRRSYRRPRSVRGVNQS